MAQNGGNRLRKQAAKAVQSRQAVAAKQQAERRASSLSGRIRIAAGAPVERCLRLADMVGAGIGHVILAKRLPSGAVGCAFFLVDLLGLGVKDAFYREMTSSDLDEQIGAIEAGGQAMVPIDAASAKALVTGAAAFAADSGLGPAKDYRTLIEVFVGIDAADASESFTFGRDGKPVYIPGPNDSIGKMREIERRMVKARGEGGWDVDVMAALPERDRIAMHGILNLPDREVEGVDDGLVIEHEGSTKPSDP